MYKPILVLKIPPHVAPEVIKTKFRMGVNGVSGRSVKRFSLSVSLSVYTCESLH
jgi:hypothetical protein